MKGRLLSTALRSARRATLCSMCLPGLLPHTQLPYRGVLVDVAPDTKIADFQSQLVPSLAAWSETGHKSCMLRLPIEHAGLATFCAEHGFTFHHAEGRHAVMKCWLQPHMEDKVPPFATHQVGIAGLVVDRAGRILLVREWSDEAGQRVPSKQWKLPGGLLDRGESFEEAAVREVREETGVNTEFRSILSFWHRHGLTWGKSDLYYVARLECASDEEVITLQEDEISEATWMPIDEFMSNHDHPLINAVLTRVYGLPEHAPSTTEPPMPLIEMVAGNVKWPGREPYTTYFGSSG